MAKRRRQRRTNPLLLLGLGALVWWVFRQQTMSAPAALPTAPQTDPYTQLYL